MSKDMYVRILNILIILALACSITIAGEVTVSLDRVAPVIPAQDDYNEYSSRAAIHFTLPNEVLDKEIIFARLFIPFEFEDMEIIGDSLLEVEAFDITAGWNEDNTTWNTPWTMPGGDIDTLSSYTYTIRLGQDNNVQMDITRFVRAVVNGDLVNHGVMLIPYKYDLPVIHVPLSIIDILRNSAQIEIVYK